MSDRPIQAGDLVAIIKPSYCCGKTDFIGKIYRVSGFTRDSWCGACGKVVNGVYALAEDGYHNCDVSRLKRIDPQSEGDSLPTRREMEETA